ncbi:arsenate reductase ArsC [Flaviflexus salsibiostraticola]|uniref:Arsenate reductase ArsC n=1 Tax=Flaviflexus salsibiostraticola TaxID=1282737 RepID=A0A3S8Z8E5_9ACTO|nr:arsenate reductase ArsC [Flaviflexus salsibiostraticola]AZN29733.1 arsenate reductase ArsC [Flaviflexus salsibiostraticola]
MTEERPGFVTGIIDDLTYVYSDSFSPQEVQETVIGVWNRAKDAPIALHLPVLIRSRSRELLIARAQAEGRIPKRIPEILFICVRNEGRSQLAAALAEHLSGHRVHVRSAGTHPTGEVSPITVQALAERGISLDAPYPKPVHTSVVDAADVVVTMGVRQDEAAFPGKRYEHWDVPDPAGQPIEAVRDIRDDLQARVTRLLREILD